MHRPSWFFLHDTMTTALEWYHAMFFGCPVRGEKTTENRSIIAVL
ncbi:hypothetical protein IB211_00738c [Intestinimonas butyriciproducens]|uniref:Uncharacterized protein n=1 Tax=Intestinimonas butyriciproducens TaxID=1297617 RepID=A0A0S2W1C2_9FIRM|nr:hypothetical protein IB211_00738c [Intestinimonas butyriciproducens]QBB66681.1 hypothetical protein SRB521_02423 [Intestinimonas butyriciproducens]